MSTQDPDAAGRRVGPAEPEPGADQRQQLEVEVVRLRRRVDELEARPPTAGQRVRDVATVVLVVLTVLAIALTSVAVWLRSTVFDTDRFMAAVQPALTSPEVADALSARLTAETVQALDLQTRLDTALTDVGDTLGTNLGDALGLTPAQRQRIQSLPIPQLEQLAGPIADGIEGRISQLMDRVVVSPQFQTLLVDLTRSAHERGVALVRGDTAQLPNVEVTSGEVRLNLVPAVAQALSQLVDQGLQLAGVDPARIPNIDATATAQTAIDRLSQALNVNLPSDFGQVVIMSRQDLVQLQSAVRLADQLVWGLVVATIVLVAVTVLLSRHRRRTVVQLGVGTAIATVVTMLLLRNAQGTVAGQAPTPEGQAAVGELTNSVLNSLRGTMLLVLVVALLVALAAHLLGRPPWAERTYAAVRRGTATKPGGSDVERAVARHTAAYRIGVLAVGLLVLAITGISLLSVLIVVPLVLLALWGIAVADDRAGARSVDEAGDRPGDAAGDRAGRSPAG